MENNFKSTIKKQLKQYLKGRTSIHIISDTLIVDVFTLNGTAFRYTREQISYEIQQGKPVETLIEDIVQRYRVFIKSLYFI